MANNSNDRFAPIRIIKQPNNRLPIAAPIEEMEPDYDNYSVVSGPELNEVTGDNSNGSAGENHPMLTPKPTPNKLTERGE